MKRALALTLAALMLIAFLVGCNKDTTTPDVSVEPSTSPSAEVSVDVSESPSPEVNVDTDEVIELTVLNYLDLSGPSALQDIEVIWNAFEEAHPNIKLIREDEFEESFHNKVEAYAAAGTLPDVMLCWPSGRSTTLHANHLLKDLGPLVARDGLASFFTPVSLDGSQQAAGYLAMIPMGATATNAFLINHEILDECGLQPAKTYSELVAQVPVLKAAGYQTILMANQSTWVMQSCLFSAVVGRFMGEGWDEKILAGQTDFMDPDFIAALDFIKMMYDDGVISKDTIAIDYGEGPGLFANNTAAYFVDGDWIIGNFLTDPTTGEALIDPERQNNFSVTVFPEIDRPGVKFNRSNSVVLATGWGMNADLEDGSAKLEAAWELVKWLVGKEAQTHLLATGGSGSTSRTDIDFASISMEPLQIALANMGNDYDIATVVVDGSFEGPVHEPINDGLQAIGLGLQTPQQVAEVVQAAYEEWKATR